MTTLAVTRPSSRRRYSISGAVIVGNVRVQALSSTLVRIELKGPKGFEDRPTFTVPSRTRAIAPIKSEKVDGVTFLTYPDFQVVVPGRLRSHLSGVQVRDRDGRVLVQLGKKLPTQSFLPDPASKIAAYVVADQPRLIPPKWGATPQPSGNAEFPEASGWDTTNDAPDVYVFVPGAGGYQTLRHDFLNLTGPIPIPPLWSFGYWDSQWYPYTEKEALDSIDLYRTKQFPLDGFVVDTDWRVNGSDGYEIATKFFPDMGRFIAEAHKRGVYLMFNDHPEPAASTALAPKEFARRWKGLTSLLRLGLDAWWFDRNWHTKLHEPMPGIAKEVWGQRMFHDITLRFRPNIRPMIMSNAEGVDNGNRNRAPHPAGHRFPIMWSGDTFAEWRYLTMGIVNNVDLGVIALHPYVNEDLGGHHSHPTNELYARFLQYGAFSPAMRVHCTLHQERHPWSFGKEVEEIVRDYVQLRYRLLPTIYSAARQVFETGTPVLRRCDLEWPAYPEAASARQFLFGDDLLVAPVDSSRYQDPHVIPTDLLRTLSGDPGLAGEYFKNSELQGKPVFRRNDPIIDFKWTDKAIRPGFPKEHHSVRWTGMIGPVPESGDYILSIVGDDGIRMWFDEKMIVDQWIIRTVGEDQATLRLEAGKSYPVVIELMQKGGPTQARLGWVLPSESHALATRDLWIPPGGWQNAWTGEVIEGPTSINLACDLRTTPIFIRQGALIAATDNAQQAGPMPWKALTLEAFPPANDGAVERKLYEDDGLTNNYLKGASRLTNLLMTRQGDLVTIEGTPTSGAFGGDVAREVTVRLHLPKSARPAGPTTATVLPPADAPVAIPLLGKGAPPCMAEGPTLEVRLPSVKVGKPFRVEFRVEWTS